jgi:hypothetical protein
MVKSISFRYTPDNIVVITIVTAEQGEKVLTMPVAFGMCWLEKVALRCYQIQERALAQAKEECAECNIHESDDLQRRAALTQYLNGKTEDRVR